jgi:hypothetical protein
MLLKLQRSDDSRKGRENGMPVACILYWRRRLESSVNKNNKQFSFSYKRNVAKIKLNSRSLKIYLLR